MLSLSPLCYKLCPNDRALKIIDQRDFDRVVNARPGQGRSYALSWRYWRCEGGPGVTATPVPSCAIHPDERSVRGYSGGNGGFESPPLAGQPPDIWTNLNNGQRVNAPQPVRGNFALALNILGQGANYASGRIQNVVAIPAAAKAVVNLKVDVHWLDQKRLALPTSNCSPSSAETHRCSSPTAPQPRPGNG